MRHRPTFPPKTIIRSLLGEALPLISCEVMAHAAINKILHHNKNIWNRRKKCFAAFEDGNLCALAVEF